MQHQSSCLALSLKKQLIGLDGECMSVSAYKDNSTTQGLINGITRIKKAFPSLPIEFYEILKERIQSKGFTDKRFADAVNSVIDTCVYPTPTIAQFISWDKRIPMFTYEQICKKFDESGLGAKFWTYYKSLQFNDKATRVWIHVNDVEQYNITE